MRVAGMNEMKIGEQKEECCSQCPYARSTPKEYLDTRGDNGEAFIGQAVTASLLPCHMVDPDGEGNAQVTTGQHQCAGAAKFRANIEVEKLPEILGRLPADTINVFSDAAELLAHHKGWSLDSATIYLREFKNQWRMGYEQQMIALNNGRVALL